MPPKSKAEWEDMSESQYRASRVCRVLGNPKSYQVLAILREMGSATPTELAPRLHRTMAATSIVLKSLRDIDLVRYQRDGKNVIYRHKGAHVEKILETLEGFVDDVRKQMR
jgi:DNA-binding transcriptional ArsR family regulator